MKIIKRNYKTDQGYYSANGNGNIHNASMIIVIGEYVNKDYLDKLGVSNV